MSSSSQRSRLRSRRSLRRYRYAKVLCSAKRSPLFVAGGQRPTGVGMKILIPSALEPWSLGALFSS